MNHGFPGLLPVSINCGFDAEIICRTIDNGLAAKEDRTMKWLNNIVKRLPGFRALDEYLRSRYTGLRTPELYQRGHFHSPLPDVEQVREALPRLLDPDVDLSASIDLQLPQQQELLKAFAELYGEFCWKKNERGKFRFHFEQDFFSPGDAIALYSMLRHFKSKKIIEAGSGFSSALMLDTREHFLAEPLNFTFIEPYPDRLHALLSQDDREDCELRVEPLEKVSRDIFQALEANDMLFIDSSHVSRVGSDVNTVLFEIMPLLQPGVIVHFHDIFWPFDYPLEWYEEGRAWNEAYLLRAFLQYNSEWEVLFFSSLLAHQCRDYLEENLPAFLDNPGGSIYLRKK